MIHGQYVFLFITSVEPGMFTPMCCPLNPTCLVTTFTAIDLPFPVPSKSLALITSFQIPNAVESCFELDPRW